jgi:hypothetical protein
VGVDIGPVYLPTAKRGVKHAGTARAQASGTVQGRITERQLPMAEACFPGISALYARMPQKPATFLQLLWAYEGQVAAAQARRARPTRRRRG